jgi:long-chain acyl-CoA synthetase
MTGLTIDSDPYADRPWLASYPPHAPADLPEASYSPLTEMFRKSLAAFPDRVAIESFGVHLTYTQVGAAAEAIAAFLQQHGLKKGDRVAIMSPNVASYPIVLFGILFAGGVVVNVNPLYTPPELEHQMNDAGARFIFVLENFAHTVAAVWDKMGVERAIVIAPGDLIGFKGALINAVSRWIKRAVKPFAIPGAIRFRDALRQGRARTFQPVEIARDDLAFLQYTGGTTGVAKGAALAHRNVAANISQAATFLHPAFSGEVIMIAALPLYHIFGLTACCLTMFQIGGCALLIANPRDIGGFIKILQKTRFTMFSGVNTLYAALLDHPDFHKLNFSELVFSLSGGMTTQSVVAERWRKVTGVTVTEAYGLSETSPAITFNNPLAEKFTGTIGYPAPSTYVSLRDDSGAPVPFGERGELCVKGPQVMVGYWKRPEETKLVTTEDGYFRTGDVAQMLPDGSFKLVDRLKEVIIVSGFNVYPTELEEVLALHPKVREVAVIGVPDQHSGESPLAYIVPRDPSLTVAELRAFVHERLTGYKTPRRYEFRDTLPKSVVGKILRRKLREEYVQETSSGADAKV